MGVHLQEKDLKTINGFDLIGVDGGNVILPLLPEAPLDGSIYGRYNSNWIVIPQYDLSTYLSKTEAENGITLKSPNETRYLLTVSDEGEAVFTEL